MPRLSALFAALIVWFSMLCSSWAASGRIVVLYGTEGRTEGDKKYNQALGGYLVRWIAECGLEAQHKPEAEARKALASPCAVAWLVGINEPTKPTLWAVDAFVKRGGKLLVVNCLSPELNAYVGAVPVGFRFAPGFATWTALRFEGNRPGGAPERVPMVVGAITECKPAKKNGATVRARWETSAGKSTPYAALLSNANGFCLTAPLPGSAKPSARRRYLLSLMGHCVPDLWREAYEGLQKRQHAEKKLTRPKKPHALRRDAYATALDSARALYEHAVQARSENRTMTATLSLLDLQVQLDRMEACAYPPWDQAICAVWDQLGYGFSPGKWDATCAELRASGVTDLILLVATPLWTHATVPGLEPSPLRKVHGDQLAQATRAAHAHGLRIHAWVAAFGLMNPSAKEIAELHAAGRLLVGADGKPMPWLNPRMAANGGRLQETILHLARTYDIDGIHLDYIRYGSTLETPTQAERAMFETAMKQKAKKWPEDVSKDGPLWEPFLAYRRYAIGGTVRTLRERLRTENPKLLLSAAVYGNGIKSRDNVGQDWLAWLSNDYLDWALPMNYAHKDMFEKILDTEKCPPKIRRRIVSGIGVTAAECNLSPREIVEEMDILRRRGYGGYAFFDLDATLQDEVLPVLHP